MFNILCLFSSQVLCIMTLLLSVVLSSSKSSNVLLSVQMETVNP